MKVRRKKPVVAIDGPAGAGKSTASKEAARALGFVYVDTGAMFRGIALLALESCVDPSNQDHVERMTRDAVMAGVFRVERGEEVTRVLIHGTDPGERIRTPEIGRIVPIISAYAAVREAMLKIQRELGREGGIVMEGRDIGTSVFPDAEVKIFLTASDEERARRRQDEWNRTGTAVSFATALEDVRRRDRQDREREIAPLRQAEDAVEIDSTGMEPAAVIQRIVALARECMAA